MAPRVFRYLVLGLLLMMGGESCTAWRSSSSANLPSSAFFSIDAAQLSSLQAIGQAQDARMKNCHKGTACEEAYYIRGLVALFENRADAITVFQELHTAMPDSRYDVATSNWLNLLQDSAPVSVYSQALMIQLKEEVLHNLLERSDVADRQNLQDHERRVAELNN
jgi:hypothetical protein